MLLRSCLLIWLAGTVVLAGCHAPHSPDTLASNGSSAHPGNHLRNGMDDDIVLLPPVSKASATNIDDAEAEAHAHYGSGIIHEMNGDIDQSLSEYFEAARLDPTNESLVLDVSRLFLQASQPGKALEILTRAAAAPTASAAVMAQLGFAYSKVGNFDKAAQADRAAIQKDPQSLLGYQTLFLDYMQTKQPQQALAVLDDAAKVKGTRPEFLIGLAELYLNFAGQNGAQRSTAHSRAGVVLERAAKMDIPDPELRLRLADGLNLLGKDDRAAEIYKKLLTEVADDPSLVPSIRAKLADLYLQRHDAKGAAEQLEAITRANPTDPQAYFLLGSLAIDQTNCAQAVDYFTKTVLFKPEFEPAYYELASAQLCANQPEDALATLTRARSQFPQNFLVDYLSGLAYVHQKKFSNALNHFTMAEITAKTSESNKLTGEFYFQFGAASERAGDFAQAEKYFEKCLQLSPDFDEAQNYFGYMLAERGEKLRLTNSHSCNAAAMPASPVRK